MITGASVCERVYDFRCRRRSRRGRSSLEPDAQPSLPSMRHERTKLDPEVFAVAVSASLRCEVEPLGGDANAQVDVLGQ